MANELKPVPLTFREWLGCLWAELQCKLGFYSTGEEFFKKLREKAMKHGDS
jgi:hypothetical protein